MDALQACEATPNSEGSYACEPTGNTPLWDFEAGGDVTFSAEGDDVGGFTVRVRAPRAGIVTLPDGIDPDRNFEVQWSRGEGTLEVVAAGAAPSDDGTTYSWLSLRCAVPAAEQRLSAPASMLREAPRLGFPLIVRFVHREPFDAGELPSTAEVSIVVSQVALDR